MTKGEAFIQLWREFHSKLFAMYEVACLDPEFDIDEFLDDMISRFHKSLSANKLPIPSVVYQELDGLRVSYRWGRVERVELERELA